MRSALAVLPAHRGHAHPPPPGPAESPGIDVGLLLRTLRQRLYIVIVMVVVGVGLGAVVQSKLPPRFTSWVSILLDPKRADSFGAETQFGSIIVDSAKIASVVSIIESSDLLGRVVKALSLGDDAEFGEPADTKLHQWFGFLPFVKAPPVRNDAQARSDRALGRLEKALRVDRVGVTYVLTVSVSASRPEMAQKLAATVADAYLNDQLSIKMAATQRDSAWLAEQLGTASGELVRSEEAVEAIRRKYGLLETDRGSGVTTDRQTVTELNTQLTQAQTDLAARKARYEQAQHTRAAGGNLEGLPEAASSRAIENLRKDQADVAARLADLSRIYQDSLPEIRRLKDQQALLQKEISAEVSRIVDGLYDEYETAVARANGLKQQLQQITSTESSATSSDGRVQLRDAERTVEANKALYDSLLTRSRDVQQQQTREDPEARIISAANLPDRPSSPKPLLFPAGGGALFLFLGLAVTMGPALLDNRFVSVKDVERRLGLLVLGAIPLLRRRDLGFARRKGNIMDYATRRPLSHFAESLRMVRAYLRISADGAPSIIQVTSSVAGEGKSTVASALAASAALAGVRTVLVDVDLRSSSLSAMFGLRHEEGLSEILELGVPFRSVAREIEGMPLTVIGSGSALMPRPDAIDSRQFAALMRELSESYSLVILDSPPALPVSDALVISRHADATILVVQWRATARALAEQTVKLLRTVNAPLAGVILNKIDLSKVSKYEYGNQYHYPYGHRGSKPSSRPPA